MSFELLVVITMVLALVIVSLMIILNVIQIMITRHLLEVTGFYKGQVSARNMYYFVKSIRYSDGIPRPGTILEEEVDHLYRYLSAMIHSYIVNIDPLYDGKTRIVVRTYEYQVEDYEDVATVEVLDISTGDSVGDYKVDVRRVFRGLNKLYSNEELDVDDIFTISEHKVDLIGRVS